MEGLAVPTSAVAAVPVAAVPVAGVSVAAAPTSTPLVPGPHGDYSLSSSPRQFPTDLTSPILEEGDESESDIPNEPVTPVSGRQSQDFQSLQNQDNQDTHPSSLSSSTDHPSTPFTPLRTETGAHPLPASKVALILNTSATPPPPASRTTNTTTPSATTTTSATTTPTPTAAQQKSLLASPTTEADQYNSTAPVQQAEAAASLQAPSSAVTEAPSSPAPSQPPSQPPSRRNSRNPLPFGRKSFSFFRRSNSQTDKPAIGFSEPSSAVGSELNLPDGNLKAPPQPQQQTQQQQQLQPQQQTQTQTTTRRWSMNRSSTTTRSNSPPSPSLGEMISAKDRAATSVLPAAAAGVGLGGDGMDMSVIKKKVRSSTGLSLRTRAVNFVTSNGNGKNGGGDAASKRPKPPRRRASSFDLNNKPNAKANRAPAPEEKPNAPPQVAELLRQPWAMPADTGTGMKARRLSVSLPDDFTVDIAELQSEFEYHHKFLGRHGKHLGKGATSKVTLMMRKGCPGELYAVKEFRGKASAEKVGDYENKVKSEFSIAKSLHHPNIVETIRLCTDHGRWNHVMEYCSEGDLYSLVEKKYLKEESRQTDRLCFFKQLIQGLNYLHSNGIAHRDIKLENLLITKDSKLKITDFGVSEVFSGIHPGLREAGGQCGKNMGEIRMCSPGLCGSMPYVSPEVLAKDSPYDPRGLDVWGAAVVGINLFFGAPLWKEARDDGANPQYSALKRGWDRWNAKHPEQFLPKEEQQQLQQLQQLQQQALRDPSAPPSPGGGASPRTDSATPTTVPPLASSPPTSYPPSIAPSAAPSAALSTTTPTLSDADYPYVAAVDFGIKPPALKRLLLLMLNPDPVRRISIAGVANNRWMKNVECCQLESYDDPSTLIDASKKSCLGSSRTGRKIFCHNHLPPAQSHGHSLGKMPGQVGY